MAKTRPKLAILDPTTFPSAKSGKPSRAAFTLMISSGADVAKDTTVIPITILGMFNFKDKSTADFNSQLPPAINSTNPPKTNKKFCIPTIFFCKYNRTI